MRGKSGKKRETDLSNCTRSEIQKFITVAMNSKQKQKRKGQKKTDHHDQYNSRNGKVGRTANKIRHTH